VYIQGTLKFLTKVKAKFTDLHHPEEQLDRFLPSKDFMKLSVIS